GAFSQQRINVAPSSEPFTNWRSVLSPTWPSKELESSSVGDISVRQALENANLLQIIKSTLAGTRTRTMDQTRLLPTLYQGSGNSASQEPSEVSTESPTKPQEADEMTIVSGLPQISVAPALSTSSSVIHPATTLSSQIIPCTTSSISSEITLRSNILPNFPLPSPLSFIKDIPHIIVVSKSSVSSTKMPLSINVKHLFSTNTAKSHSNKKSGNSLSTTKYVLPRKVGNESWVATFSSSYNFELINKHPIETAKREIYPRDRKWYPFAFRALIPSEVFDVLPTQKASVSFRKNNFFSELIHKASSIPPLTSKPMDIMKKGSMFVTTSYPILKSRRTIPWISASDLHTSGALYSLSETITGVSSMIMSKSIGERALTSPESRKLSHLTNTSSSTMPTLVISEAIRKDNAIAQVLTLATVPSSHSTDEVPSLIMRTNWPSYIAADSTVSTSNPNFVSETNLTNSHITESTWVFKKDTPDRNYEATIWPSNFSMENNMQQQSFTKDSTMFSVLGANNIPPYWFLETPSTKFPLTVPVSKQAPWEEMLLNVFSQERTTFTTFPVSLPTSFRDLLKFPSTGTSVTPLNDSMKLKPVESKERNPNLRITKQEKNSVVFTTLGSHLSQPLLNNSADEHSHMVDTTYKSVMTTSDIYDLVSGEHLRTPETFSMVLTDATSESNLDTLNKALVPHWDNSDWHSTTDGSVSSGKKTTQKFLTTNGIASHTVLERTYSKIPVWKQSTSYVKNKPSSSSVASINITATSVQHVSIVPFTKTKSKHFSEFNIPLSSIETSYSPSFQNQNTLSQIRAMPLLQSERNIYTSQSFLENFTVGNTNLTSGYQKQSYSTSKDFPATNTRTSTLDTFSTTLSTHSHLWLSTDKLHRTPKPQTSNSEKLFASTNMFYTSLPFLSAYQFITKLTVPINNEDSTISNKKALPKSIVSSVPTLNVTKEYSIVRKTTDFVNNFNSETHNQLSKPSTALTTRMLHTYNKNTAQGTVKIPNEITTITPLQTYTPFAAIITSTHASQTQLTSLLPTTNFTHSVITVLPSVSPGVLSSLATSEATPVTGKSAPTSPMLTSSLFSLSTDNSPSVMALSTLKSTLAKNNTVTKMAPTLSPVVIHANFPVVSRDGSIIPEYITSSSPIQKFSTASVPTTHAPRQTEALLDTKKSTSPDISKTSTAYPLTMTAALTSITASAKTARLLPTSAENASVAATESAFVNVTTVLPLECQLSRNLLVKTVLFLNTRRLLLSGSLKQNVTKGLTLALRQAFNQNVNAQVKILEQSNNVTVGYYVTQDRLVFIPAVVIEMLIAYGVTNATLDIRKHVPNLHSVAVLALPWSPLPAYHFQLKTELQFVDESDNIQSCRFVQTMEQRLQRAFQDAERKVLNTTSKLNVQILNTSNVSQAVTLFYVVRNESTVLNGTVSSNLLNQLSAELVGFYLTFPPLTIAEALEYPNLDTSEATRDYWVITVILGVDITLLGLNNQSFARLMEQRLAPLFMMSHQQERRFKRATTIGSFTVQMVKMERIPGPREPAELTYYTLYNGKPLLGTIAAKRLTTVDSQRMALTLGYVVQVQADPVVKNPPNNLWIIAAVLAPIAVVTVIILIITAVLCRKNKNDFKTDTMMNLPQRTKPVQGFDYAKQHLGQQGTEDDVLPVTQETVVLPVPVRDAPASQEREIVQDGNTAKTAKSNDTRKSRSLSENGSVISNESGKPNSGRGSPQKVTAQQKVTKEEGRKRNVPLSDEEDGSMVFDNVTKSAIDPFDTSSGSVQLIAIKPVALSSAHPGTDRTQDTAILNGEINKALKQKSDIEHYRNKLRLKAKRKGYYDFPQIDNKGLADRKKMYEKTQNEIDHILDPDTDGSSPFVEPKNRQQTKTSVYRSRQSLNSPSPGETEMDLLVTRERQRRGIRNSGYDTEPEMIEETNIDRVNESRNYTRAHQAKGHSETSTLSSQPSIDEVRQQMHMLLEEAFSLASAGHGGQNRQQDTYNSAQNLPYSEVVTSAPGTMSRPRGGIQWVPTYRPEVYQYSLPRPAYRFSPLPEMVMGSPPPPVPPRTGPVAITSLRRSTSDIGSKTRVSESSGTEQIQPHDHVPFVPVSKAPVTVAPLDQSALNYSGNTVPAVFAIPAANRPGFTGYFIPAPPAAYRNQAWMSYAEDHDIPGQWADSVPHPGYIEAYSHPPYQHNCLSRLHPQYGESADVYPSLEHALHPATVGSHESVIENDASVNLVPNLTTTALVRAIREEVAKLAKRQTEMFEFQV
uniref:KIAA1549 like n=1 Tax=Naja naja TaxID=35670 RepID=A0A8C7E3X7_NAJNA